MRSIEQNFEHREKIIEFARQIYLKQLEKIFDDNFAITLNTKTRKKLIKECVEISEEFYNQAEDHIDN